MLVILLMNTFFTMEPLRITVVGAFGFEDLDFLLTTYDLKQS